MLHADLDRDKLRCSRSPLLLSAFDRHSGEGRNPVAVELDQAWSLLDPGLRRDDGSMGNDA
jgi:hypothetical protein